MKTLAHSLRHALLFFLSLGFVSVWAQGQVGQEEVTVVREAEGNLQDANRISFPPVAPEFTTTIPALQYAVPKKDFRFDFFEPQPVKPLALAKEKAEKFLNSYIKLGFGSQLTPLAQFAYHSTQFSRVHFGLLYDHLSMYGFAIRNQRFSDDAIKAYVRYFPRSVELGAHFRFHNLRTHFYGFPDSIRAAVQLRQVFRDYEGAVWLQDALPIRGDWRFRQELNFHYTTEQTAGVNEWFVRSQTDINKTIRKHHHITAHLFADISSYRGDTIAVLQRNLFRVGVGYLFNNDDWRIQAGFSAGVDGKKFVPLPDISVEKQVYQRYIIPYGGFRMTLQKNAFRSLAVDNPFLHSQQQLLNTVALTPYVGIKGNIERVFYNVGFQYNRITNRPFFINDSLDLRRFQVVYDTINLYRIHGDLAVDLTNGLRLGLQAEYNLFGMKALSSPWHTPAFRLQFSARYNWKDKIIAGLELTGITGARAPLAGSQVKELKGTADLSVSLEYVFKRYLSFFGNLNNIAHQKYERYYGYPSFGINGVAGARFSF